MPKSREHLPLSLKEPWMRFVGRPELKAWLCLVELQTESRDSINKYIAQLHSTLLFPLLHPPTLLSHPQVLHSLEKEQTESIYRI